MIEINGVKYDYDAVAFDGCHKIYLLKLNETKKAKQAGYDVYHIRDLPKIYDDSCPLRFIQSWDLSKTIIPQCYDKAVIFKYGGVTTTVAQELINTY